eukprot:7191324-Alexandrium_andersonii.AAC.1
MLKGTRDAPTREVLEPLPQPLHRRRVPAQGLHQRNGRVPRAGRAEGGAGSRGLEGPRPLL